MKTLSMAILAASTVAIALPVAAQTYTPYAIDAREHRQEARIYQGERSGALTPYEARNLQRREMGLRDQEFRMRARDYGHLTYRDRQILAHRENRDSRAIWRLKHNARYW